MKLKLTSILVAVCLLACCMVAPVSAYTYEQVEADYNFVDEAYCLMTLISPTKEIKGAYAKAKESFTKYYYELIYGSNIRTISEYKKVALTDASNAIGLVIAYMESGPKYTTMQENNLILESASTTSKSLILFLQIYSS